MCRYGFVTLMDAVWAGLAPIAEIVGAGLAPACKEET
jgi:hypothetical protein